MGTNDALYKTILDLLPDGILVFDGELSLLQINRAACRCLELPDPAALPGTPAGALLEGEPFRRLREGGRTQYSDTWRSPGGRWLERGFFCDAERQVFLCLLRDCTQEHLEREALLEGRTRAVELADALCEKQMLLVHDLAGLLGESAVEMKAAVREIKAAVLPGKERNDG